MHEFKVGQRYKVLGPEKMGVDGRYPVGGIMTVVNTYEDDAEDMWNLTYRTSWIKDGSLELIEEEEKEEFDITTLYRGSAKEGKVITKGATVQEWSPTFVSIVDGRADIVRIKKEDLPSLIAGLMEFMNDE